ncbi:hypothetical protein MARPO_0024s0119 [Marchantia polymorpha]|uniref:Uncharacterized protein n=1 Tax=Marchantia polymorpha TaxID=3197 RepID=A0A2R6XBY0_MARPO|nr:hypothetical protein MARPO_0024s0119 [Marchantia polymorpha]|eukprot:PTQ43623.1 hypothetical protein MARPO_0024s0119 [Marchantia polymorpha]
MGWCWGRTRRALSRLTLLRHPRPPAPPSPPPPPPLLPDSVCVRSSDPTSPGPACQQNLCSSPPRPRPSAVVVAEVLLSRKSVDSNTFPEYQIPEPKYKVPSPGQSSAEQGDRDRNRNM